MCIKGGFMSPAVPACPMGVQGHLHIGAMLMRQLRDVCDFAASLWLEKLYHRDDPGECLGLCTTS